MNPLALALGAIGQGIGALGQAKTLKSQEELYGKLGREGEADANRLQAQRQGMYSVGPTMRKYMQYSMQDPTADLQRQEAQRQSGTAVGALKAGGARALLGGLGAQQQMAASTMANIGADEYARKTGAMSTVGQMEEQNRREQRGDIGYDLGLARQQAASGMMGAFQAKQQRKQLGYDFASGLFDLGGQATGAGLFGPPVGKKGMKTPGQFSHDSNPINLMQDGAKVGEVTGGEYVVNPEQAAKIAKQSKFAAQLFRKFEKESR